MPGYFKNEAATAETIIGDWLHTGDIGYYDQVGTLSREFQSGLYWTDKLLTAARKESFKGALSL